MIAVYAHPNGTDYVAEVDELGWVRWPAERNGWRRRVPCDPAEAEWDELPEPLSMLAFLLSGAPVRATGTTCARRCPRRTPAREGDR